MNSNPFFAQVKIAEEVRATSATDPAAANIDSATPPSSVHSVASVSGDEPDGPAEAEQSLHLCSGSGTVQRDIGEKDLDFWMETLRTWDTMPKVL